MGSCGSALGPKRCPIYVWPGQCAPLSHHCQGRRLWLHVQTHARRLCTSPTSRSPRQVAIAPLHRHGKSRFKANKNEAKRQSRGKVMPRPRWWLRKHVGSGTDSRQASSRSAARRFPAAAVRLACWPGMPERRRARLQARASPRWREISGAAMAASMRPPPAPPQARPRGAAATAADCQRASADGQAFGRHYGPAAAARALWGMPGSVCMKASYALRSLSSGAASTFSNGTDGWQSHTRFNVFNADFLSAIAGPTTGNGRCIKMRGDRGQHDDPASVL